MSKKYDLTNKIVGKLKVLSLVPVNERPSQKHGNYWLCECECGNLVKVPTSYLTGNGNYIQKSCGCDRKKKAFEATSNINLTSEELEQYDDFEKFLLIHKALIRTSGNDSYYYNNHPELYREIINYFYYEKQFNALYSFWKNSEMKNVTFYDWAKPSLDHIVPKSKGGTNTLDNFQFLTTFENLAKRDMTMEEWQNFKKRTHTCSDYFIENIMKRGQEE